MTINAHKNWLRLVLLPLAFLTPATWAQPIPNPSFESNTFTVFPGYVSDNPAITSWIESPTIPSANWTLSPSVSQNPATVSIVSNKFYRLYRP